VSIQTLVLPGFETLAQVNFELTGTQEFGHFPVVHIDNLSVAGRRNSANPGIPVFVLDKKAPNHRCPVNFNQNQRLRR